MLTADKITEIFCVCDDFCKEFNAEVEKNSIKAPDGRKHRCRNGNSDFENSEFGRIRTLTGENGEPWFVGKDVAEVLGYKNTKDALSKHVDSDDKQGSQIATSGQRREMTFINESGLYSLILSSKLPKAREFKHRV